MNSQQLVCTCGCRRQVTNPEEDLVRFEIVFGLEFLLERGASVSFHLEHLTRQRCEPSDGLEMKLCNHLPWDGSIWKVLREAKKAVRDP